MTDLPRASAIAFDTTATVTPRGGPPIVYRLLGRGERMLLLHGGSGSWRHWALNLKVLAERFTLCVPDLPGFGDSGDVPTDITVARYVELATEATELIWPGEQPFHVIGFSFGGMTAAGLANRLSQRILGMSLLAPAGFGPPVGRKGERKRRAPGMGQAEVREVHRHNLGLRMLSDPAKADDSTLDLHLGSIERARFRNWGLSRSLCTPDFLSGTNFPLQLMWGEHDALDQPTVADRVAMARVGRPDLRFHLIPGAGHWAQYEQSNTVNELLLGFHSPRTG